MAPERYLHDGLTKAVEDEYQAKTFLGGKRLAGRTLSFVLLGILSMAILGGINILANIKSSTASNELAASHDLVARAEGIQKTYWQIRGEERGFLLSNDADHVTRYEAAITVIAEELDTFFRLPDATTVRDHVTTINEGLAQHASEFRRVVQAEKALTLARKGAVKLALPNSSRDSSAKLSKEDAMHLKDLTKSTAAMMEQEKRTAHLDEIFAYMLPNVETLVAFARDRLVSATAQDQSTRSIVRLVVPGTGIAVLLVFTVLGLFLFRSVTMPVRALAMAARRLADGDNDTNIPAQGNNDEIGDMARILASFRSNFGEVDQLRRDLQTAKAEVEESARELQRAQDLAPMAQSLDSQPEPSTASSTLDTHGGELTSARISALSQQVAISSQTVSAAAFEAERTGDLIKGLTAAAVKIDEIEDLLDAIAQQLPPGDDPASVEFSGVRETADEATLAMRDLGAAISRVKRLALEIADTRSSQALDTTADLLQRSEDLRGMLDDLVSQIRTTTGD